MCSCVVVPPAPKFAIYNNYDVFVMNPSNS